MLICEPTSKRFKGVVSLVVAQFLVSGRADEFSITHKITGLPPVSIDEVTAGRQLRCIFLLGD
jgi:hypothetical protein